VALWRKKPKSTDHYVGDFGSAEINVTKRRGELPLIDIKLSMTAEYAHGLDFQHKRDELGLHHPETLHALHVYAVTLGGLPGRRDEAIELLDWLVAARADDQENRLLALNDLTRLLQNSGNLTLAEQRLREALSGWERLRGQDDAQTLQITSNLASVLIDLGRKEAEGLMPDTAAPARSAPPIRHVEQQEHPGRNVAWLACSARQGRAYAPGDPGRHRRHHRPDSGRAAQPRSRAHPPGQTRRGTEDVPRADRRSVATTGRRSPGHVDRPAQLRRRAQLARPRHRGRDTARQGTRGYRRAYGPRHTTTLGVQVDLAATRANQGRNAEAMPLLRDAIEGYRSTHGPNHPLVRELTGILAQLGG
jgi:hypothetical protein